MTADQSVVAALSHLQSRLRCVRRSVEQNNIWRADPTCASRYHGI